MMCGKPSCSLYVSAFFLFMSMVLTLIADVIKWRLRVQQVMYYIVVDEHGT